MIPPAPAASPSEPLHAPAAIDALMQKPSLPISESREFSSAWLTRAYLPLLLLLCAAYARTPLSGAIDFWAHAAIGRWIDLHGRVPSQTLYLWGAPPQHWIAHSWLTQWVFYRLLHSGDEIFGAGLTIAFCVFIVCAIYALLWRLWARHSRPGFAASLIFALAIWCSAPRFHPRPELFTALFLAVLLLFLIARQTPALFARCPTFGHREIPSGVSIGIVLMFALWANFHGAVAFGLVMLAITIAGDAAQDRCDRRWRVLVLLSLCCLLATLCNPYGSELWQALRAVKSTTFQSIEEWKAPLTKPPLPMSFVQAEITLSLLALLSWTFNPHRRWAHGGWLLFMAFSFAGARRNLWLLAIVSLGVMAANAAVFDSQSAWRRWRSWSQKNNSLLALAPPPEPLRWIARAGAVAILICAVARALPRGFWPPRAIDKAAPVQLTRWVREQKLQGHVFNDYEFSSYELWAFAGRPRLFIDLLNAYPDRLMNDYFDVLGRTPRGLSILRSCDIVLLRPIKPKEGLLHLQEFLDARPTEWARVYRHLDGTIWVRRNARLRRIWSRFEAKKSASPRAKSTLESAAR